MGKKSGVIINSVWIFSTLCYKNTSIIGSKVELPTRESEHKNKTGRHCVLLLLLICGTKKVEFEVTSLSLSA